MPLGVPRGLLRRRSSPPCCPGRAGDPAAAEVFELEKAVYELRYELGNRPDWVSIPVAGIVRMLEADAMKLVA